MPIEPKGSLLNLVDEEGKEHEFELLASLEYNGSNYLALTPSYTSPEEYVEGDGNLVILKSVTDEDSGEELLAPIDDDSELDVVSHKFEKMLDDEYEILYDDDDEEEGEENDSEGESGLDEDGNDEGI